MKITLFVIPLATVFFYQNSLAQNVGIGTTIPLTNLHIKNGASGVTPFPASLLAVESNVNTYINLLSPAVNETAILFGQPGNAANGVIMYNNPSTPSGFQFRTNGNLTKMVLNNNGNLGIGDNTPSAKLSISLTGSELAGTVASNAFKTNAGILGTSLGSEISIANIGFMSSNNSSLGIKGYRNNTGSDWTSTALLLGYDVDNTVRASGAFLAFNALGNMGIGTVNPASSAVFDVSSSSKGFLPPRMTMAQRNAIPSPTAGLMIYCNNCSPAGPYSFNGTAWVSMTTIATSYTLGQNAQGGIIFWLEDNGEHGLVAATADLSGGGTVQWWWNGPFVWCNRLRNDGVYTGKLSTDSIVSRHNHPNTGFAAGDCAKYLGGEYGDWYLPSKSELRLMWPAVGLAADWYWSSTEIDFDKAVSVNMGTLANAFSTKSEFKRVRPIRRF